MFIHFCKKQCPKAVKEIYMIFPKDLMQDIKTYVIHCKRKKKIDEEIREKIKAIVRKNKDINSLGHKHSSKHPKSQFKEINYVT